jgi:predicted O-methyltransferase YrrM
MKFREIAKKLEGIPYLSVEDGKFLYNHVIKTKPKECLELGFAHGVSSCYIAAALQQNGKGYLTSVDLLSSNMRKPSIEDLLYDTGLENFVTVVREVNSYNWYLKKKIETQTVEGVCEPIFDFCFIDGSKNWTIDGFAFFLVDKLLRESGTILFDDYGWSYSEHNDKQVTDGISHREMSEDQLHSPNIKLVFQLLVMQHPNYSNFQIDDESWAWARKIRSDVKTLTLHTKPSFKYMVYRVLRRFY